MTDQETRLGDWMQTYTGRMFWPVDPRPEDVSPQDIGHALSMMCRFNGHCREFYSVAEHSVLVAKTVIAMGGTPAEAFWGLFHDAAEAYVADIVRPLKPSLTNYKAVEARVMRAICRRLGISEEEPPIVKRADNAVLAAEAQQAVHTPHPAAWNLPEPPADVQVRFMPPAEARRAFYEAALFLQRAVTDGLTISPDGEVSATAKPAPSMASPTGETCSTCGGFNLRRAGTCMTCQDCGTTTGCS